VGSRSTPPTRSSSPGTFSSSRPSTPARGRPLNGSGLARYPSFLGAAPDGHVPLHRRGTSRTYERLEDLLKEAGYKDTRIFTPEAERVRSKVEADLESTPTPAQKGPVNTVVDFISGLVNSRAQTPAPNQASSPPSPTAFLDHQTSPSPSPSPGWSNLHPAPHPHAAQRSQTDSVIHAPGPYASSSSSIRPRPSQAGLSYSEAAQAHHHLRHAALRHMASVPDLSPRTRRIAATHTSSALRRVASTRPTTSSGRSQYLQSQSQSQSQSHAKPHAQSQLEVPGEDSTSSTSLAGPIPTTWLDAVARAVLGVPAPKRRRPSRSPVRRTQPPGTARGRTFAPSSAAPGNYLARAPTATGAVNTARVVCRSAPGSRATSLARRSTNGTNGNGKGSIRSKNKGGGNLASAHVPRVPVLAKTAVESDSLWNPTISPADSGVGLSSLGSGSGLGSLSSLASTLGSGSGSGSSLKVPRINLAHSMDMDADADELNADADTDDTDDDDGELDLARMLVPPKRQNSIQSLRRHLTGPNAMTAKTATRGSLSRASVLGSQQQQQQQHQNQHYSQQQQQHQHQNQNQSLRSRAVGLGIDLNDADLVSDADDAGTGDSRGASKRPELPTHWSNSSTSTVKR
jgi:hypothetical protein